MIWGASWGSAWGSSWGVRTETPVEEIERFPLRVLSFGPNRLYSQGNTQFFSCTVVREDDAREPVDDAVVEMSVYTFPGGNLVTGADWPLSLEPTGDQYEGELSADANLIAGKQYRMVVSATRAGLKSTYEQVVTCRTRMLP